MNIFLHVRLHNRENGGYYKTIIYTYIIHICMSEGDTENVQN